MERELTLRPGAFDGFDGTALGDAVTFENAAYSARCYPLLDVAGESLDGQGKRSTGTVLAWIHRAHVVRDRVFIEPCRIDAPIEASATHLAGHVAAWWYEATLVDAPDAPSVELRRLTIAGWSPSATPSFCGAQVAFWSRSPDRELTAHVVDLLEPRADLSASFGQMALAPGDVGWGVQPAEWSANCGEATFKIDSGQTRVIQVVAPH